MDKQFNEALRRAAQYNNVAEIKKHYTGNEVLYDIIATAGAYNNLDVLKYLITLKTSQEDLEYGMTEALFMACQNGHLAIVDFLISRGAHLLPFRDGESRTHLHAAAGRGRKEIVLRLLDAGVPADIRNEDNFTPLMEAVGNERTEIVELLITHGADPFLKDEYGLSAKKRALRCNEEIKSFIGAIKK